VKSSILKDKIFNDIITLSRDSLAAASFDLAFYLGVGDFYGRLE